LRTPLGRRLYVSDLDGTLLDRDARLSSRSRLTLDRLLRDGLLFTVASARSVVAMQTILEGLALDLPVIEMNGAFLSDLETGRHHVINDLGADLAEEVLDLLWTAGHAPFVSTFDGTRDRLYHGGARNPGMQWYIDERARSDDGRVQQVDDLRPRLGEHVVCFTVIDRRERLETLRARILETLRERVSVRRFQNEYFPAWDWLTVHARAATKDRAIATLIEWADLGDPEVVAFGDSDNDVALFRAADRTVAVANASPDIKALATSVIGPSWEDSVVAYIEGDAAGWPRGRPGEA
jgi:Cof subfamily protein (haloacid dehalogenase superfamily)